LREKFREWQIEPRRTVAGPARTAVSAGIPGRRDPLGVDSRGSGRRDQTGDRRPL